MRNRQFTHSLFSERHKLQCPSCEHDTYKRYRNNDTEAFDLPYEIGKCDRENNCGYHKPPFDYFKDKMPLADIGKDYPMNSAKPSPPKPQSFTDFRLVNQSRADIENKTNNFVQYLQEKVGKRQTIDLIERFHIGTSRYWAGATVFWQINQEQDVCGGKVMLYDAKGKRVRKPFSHVSWVHSIMKTDDYNLKQCLFGLHQLELEDPEKTIAIVESEKSAILMSAICPQFIWLATGGKDGAKVHETDNLIGRDVALFPDLGAEIKWSAYTKKARDNGINAVLHNWCAHPTDEQISEGLDPADFITDEEFSTAHRNAHLDWCSRIWAGQCSRIGEKYTNARIEQDFNALLESLDKAANTLNESKFIKAMQMCVVSIENSLMG